MTVRRQPTLRIIGSLGDGESMRISGHQGPWARLSTRGWIHTSYLVDAATDLRRRIAQLLGSPEVRSISFGLAGVRINGALYGRVAGHIMDTSWPYTVRITTNPSFLPVSRTTGRRVAGMYSRVDRGRSGQNTLFLRGRDVLSTDEDRSTLVHECAHIIYDMLRVPCVGMDIEAAAFVTETWYLINLRGPNPAAAKPALVEVTRDVMARSDGPGSPARITQAERHRLHRSLIQIGYQCETARYARPDGLQRHVD